MLLVLDVYVFEGDTHREVILHRADGDLCIQSAAQFVGSKPNSRSLDASRFEEKDGQTQRYQYATEQSE